jgi:hypothetical protein
LIVSVCASDAVVVPVVELTANPGGRSGIFPGAATVVSGTGNLLIFARAPARGQIVE